MMNQGMGLGIELRGKDMASPAIGAVRKGLVRLQGEGDKTRDSLGRFVSQGQKGFGALATSAGGARRDMSRVFEAMKDGMAAGAVATTAKGLIGLGSAWELASTSGDFEAAMSRLVGISGASGSVLKGMRNAALDAGATMGVMPAAAADALSSLSTAGFQAKDALGMLQPTLELTKAALGKMSSEQSANLIAQSLNVFGLKAGDASGTADKLARSADLFAINIEDLPLGIANMSRGLGALKVNADDAITAFGLVKASGLSTESAGTAVAVSMQRLATPETQRALKGVGVQVVDNNGKFRSFLNIIQELGPAMAGMTDAKRANFLQDTFGSEAMAGVIAMLGQFENGIAAVGGAKGVEGLAKLREEFGNSKGALERFAAITGDNLPGAMAKAASAWTTLKTVVGEPFGDLAKDAIVGLTQGVRDLTRWFREMPAGTKQAIATFVLVTSTVLAVAGTVGGAIATVVIFGKTIAAAALTMGPLLVVMGLATGAIFGFKDAAEKNLGGIGTLFGKVSLAARALGDYFVNGFISGPLNKELEAAGNGGVLAFVEKVGSYVERAKGFLSGLADGFESAMLRAAPTLQRLSNALGKFADTLGITSSMAEGEGTSALVKWGAAGERVGSAVAGAFETMTGILARGIEFVDGYTSSYDAMGLVVEPLASAFHEVRDAVNDAMSAMGIAPASGADGFWRGLGATIGFVASMFGGVLANTIQVVAGIFNGVVNVIAGGVGVIWNLLQGDWAAAWSSAGRVVFGIFKVVSSVVLGMVEQIGRVIDAAGKLSGLDLGLGSKLAEFRKGIDNRVEGTLVGDGLERSQNRFEAQDVGAFAERSRVQQNRAKIAEEDAARARPRASMGSLRLLESSPGMVLPPPSLPQGGAAPAGAAAPELRAVAQRLVDGASAQERSAAAHERAAAALESAADRLGDKGGLE